MTWTNVGRTVMNRVAGPPNERSSLTRIELVLASGKLSSRGALTGSSSGSDASGVALALTYDSRACAGVALV